jgi:thiosulfate/3-mercaptopyruvate sulfurtransferase
MTDPFLTPAELAVRREHGDLIILDATVELAAAQHDGDHRSASGRPGWEQSHIPGSRHADLLNDLSDPSASYHFARPSAAALAAALTELGVHDGVPVVTYDRAGGIWAARLWWLLDWIGVESYVLDGGLTAWRAAGHPVITSPPGSGSVPGAPAAASPPGFVPGVPASASPSGSVSGVPVAASPPVSVPAVQGAASLPGFVPGVPVAVSPSDSVAAGGTLTPRPRAGRWVDRDDIERWLAGETQATVLCALNPEAYAGEVPTRYSRRGHIPGTGNLPARSLLGPDGRFRPEPGLRQTFGDLLTDPAPIWLYCGGGISATTVGLALTALGRDDVALYDGSLEEWSADPQLPIELGR